MTDSVPRELQEEPPSAKFVFYILQERGPCLSRELVVATTLPSSTVRNALGRLEERGVVTSNPSTRDARAQQYELTESK